MWLSKSAEERKKINESAIAEPYSGLVDTLNFHMDPFLRLPSTCALIMSRTRLGFGGFGDVRMGSLVNKETGKKTDVAVKSISRRLVSLGCKPANHDTDHQDLGDISEVTHTWWNKCVIVLFYV
jgi:hypothetical protein